ncbi:rhamnosyltransferase [Pseudomonas sp. ok272]|uniref:glycosyltransferase n=1 Tax=unclassified Pseudomonas TaxID=196821 RepID=UPI0008D3170E|nr:MULTISPECIES: glycosyltransferase family 2 protein [unclassified Pseudomonas]SEM87139.1 rhamnosyltransferase [Pseudomonas sp. ok272]SFM76778.1 rhamnosyltransferase [Pseudomonas sp. ok602]
MHSESLPVASLASRTSVIVLTLDAQVHLKALLPALAALKQAPREVLFIDSASTDLTPAMIEAAGHRLMTIKRSDFGHGKTRNLALDVCADSEYLVYLTQDACPQGDDWLQQLLKPFADPQVALVYGQQLPRREATDTERFAREFNYPDQPERTTQADIARLGIKAVFCSNSFAAYRRTALEAIGGFPTQLPLGEDMAAAARLLGKGYARVYEPAAQAVHSHDYSIREEFKRYFDIGTLIAMDRELSQARLATSGEGLRFVKVEIQAALTRGQPLAILSILMRTAGKFLGYWLGERYRLVPLAWRRRMSMHSLFWNQP